MHTTTGDIFCKYLFWIPYACDDPENQYIFIKPLKIFLCRGPER